MVGLKIEGGQTAMAVAVGFFFKKSVGAKRMPTDDVCGGGYLDLDPDVHPFFDIRIPAMGSIETGPRPK
jgi:hypothetical protein